MAHCALSFLVTLSKRLTVHPQTRIRIWPIARSASWSHYLHTYIHTYNFICFSRLQKKAAYADVDLLKTYLKYLQHLIGLILQITLKYL